MAAKQYGNKRIEGDSACPKCREHGGDVTGNHLQHWINDETQERWVYCSRDGYYVKIDAGNLAQYEGVRNTYREMPEEERRAKIAEIQELPIKELKSRGIKHAVAERYGVRVGLSSTDGETPVSHFYPKTKDGETRAYKVRNLEHKSFYAIGSGSGCDLFGIEQARLGDIWNGRLHIFEDELSAMSAFQVLTEAGKGSYKPACVSLPDGAAAAATAIARNAKFIEGFQEIIVCMDNDDAGEEAINKIRAMLPNIKIARIPKGFRKDGKPVKDANDMLMDGRGVELNNLLRFNAAKESPAGAATVADCLDDALKKPEWGLNWPWAGLTQMTFGLRYGEVISVGGGVGGWSTSSPWVGTSL